MRLRAAAIVLALCASFGVAEASGVAGPRGDAAPLARLDIVDRGDGPEAWAENFLSGPIEVVLRARGAAPPARPALPARATVPPLGRVLVSRMERADAELLLEVVPGHPGARPRDVEYGWPLGTHALRVGQGWGGGFSHRDQENRYAVDFAVPEGTPVLAARDGVVMQLEAGFATGGLDSPEDIGRANFIRILHDDGTMAVYAHLAPGGAQVRQGERVRRGQRIGASGSTGYSGGPHLHFAVQANRGLRLASLPFRMFGPGGILRFSEAAEAVE
jgi:murein DD-endopeptidase MepM/ murein hydrolase activator NlpD